MVKLIFLFSLLIVFNSCQKKINPENKESKLQDLNLSTTDKKYIDENGWIKMSDINVKDFVNELKVKNNSDNKLNLLITIGQTDENWISESDLPFLISKIDSKEKAKCINQAISSFLPNPENMTIGNQVISIIEAYRKNEPYPNALYICEIYDIQKIEEIRQWWKLKKR
jgi:hypothetical protein